MPKISICIPVYNMENSLFFIKRNIQSILKQNYKDYEIIVSDDSPDNGIKDFLNNYPVKYIKNPNHGMALNSNNAISHASGELIKILYQDDYLYTNTSLGEMVKHFTDRTIWMAVGCTHTIDGQNFFNPHRPYYSEHDNTIGSPSVIIFRKGIKEKFDPNFGYVLDLDLYKRLFKEYGRPKIYDKILVVIGIGLHQTTSKLSQQEKINEHLLLKQKYEPHS